MRKRICSSLAGLLTGVVAAWPSGHAVAQTMPACSSLPNPLYLQIGDTQEPLIKNLGRKLRDSQVAPMTLVYITSGSCTNVDAISHGTKLTMNPLYVPSTAENAAWTPSMASVNCTIAAGGVNLDVANSNVFTSICTQTTIPTTIGQFYGGIQPYVFVVPTASDQIAITAEEAYFVFGFPNGGMVAPWTDEAQHMIRTTSKSTLLALAANINVPPAKWRGMMFDKSSQVVDAVSMDMTPEATIGILGAEVYDANRTKLKSLAFRAYGQKYAFWPDSTPSARDKQNTRDGHYTAWSPTVYMTAVDQSGVPTSTKAAYLIDLITNKTPTPTPDFEPLDVITSVGLVPACAMKVQRMREGGDLSQFSSDQPCGCYFESKVGTPSASCMACTTDTTCGAGKCRHGFCEAK
jgi:hypothetical protein